MARTFISIAVFGFVGMLLLAMLFIWNYSEINKTRNAKNRLAETQQNIAIETERVSVLRAEWAYLNRPERLRMLVNLNFDPLRLIPLRAMHFGEIEQIGFPEIFELNNTLNELNNILNNELNSELNNELNNNSQDVQ